MAPVSGETIITYLDNAATTFPKPEQVYQSLDRVSRTCAANPGRGSHRLAHEAAQLILTSRMALADFFNIADCARIAFTANATEAINLALFGLLQMGDRVVTTSMEHNAVARPLHALQQRGVDLVKVEADGEGRITLEQIQQACDDQTRLVVMSHCSNVTGTLQPIETIGPWCREQGIIFMVDAAQSAGVYPIDVQRMAIDLLAIPGHKSLFGPQGTGCLYVDPALELTPVIYGGTGTYSSQLTQPQQMPEHLESGTLNTPALAALAEGVRFVEIEGLTRIRLHEQHLVERLRQGLAELDGVKLYGPEVSTVVSFTVDGMDPSEIGFLLDHHYQIAVRVGLHCAPEAHRTIGTFPQGTVRVSPGYFNTSDEIDQLLKALKELIRQTSTSTL